MANNAKQWHLSTFIPWLPWQPPIFCSLQVCLMMTSSESSVYMKIYG